MEHVQQTTPAGFAPTSLPLSSTCAPPRAACHAIFTVGFCFGGRQSWLAAADGHGLAGAIGFYGGPGERNGEPGPTQRAAEMAAPILALQAGDDQHITAADNDAFEARSQRQACRTRSSRTTARRTASSTGVTTSSRTHRPTPGRACSDFSTATAPLPSSARRFV